MSARIPRSLSLAVLALPSLVLAQTSNVSPQSSYCWSENIGWLNWRDAGSPPASQGAYSGSGLLSGFVWSENAGWINLGSGLPANIVAYSNTTGADFGVNVLPGGELSGLAWGENIGWINFDAGAMATPPKPARVDLAERRLYGYAWGENVGWINLDDSAHYVGFFCPSDYNQDEYVNGIDFDEFVEAFEAGAQAADFNHDTWVNGIDFDEFIQAFEAGC